MKRKCIVCGRTFNNKKKFKEHLEIELNELSTERDWIYFLEETLEDLDN